MQAHLKKFKLLITGFAILFVFTFLGTAGTTVYAAQLPGGPLDWVKPGIERLVMGSVVTDTPTTEPTTVTDTPTAEPTTATAVPSTQPSSHPEEISGTIETINGNVITINGQQITISDMTEVSGTLAVGATVKIEVTVDANGNLIAKEVDVSGVETDDDTEHHATETVTPGTGTGDDHEEHATMVPGKHSGDDQEEHSGSSVSGGTSGSHEGDENHQGQQGQQGGDGEHDSGDHHSSGDSGGGD